MLDCLDEDIKDIEDVEGMDEISEISSSLRLFKESENLGMLPPTVWLNLGVDLMDVIGVAGPSVLLSFKNFPGVLGRFKLANLRFLAENAYRVKEFQI